MFSTGDRVVATFSRSTFSGTFLGMLVEACEYGDSLLELDGGLGTVEVFTHQLRLHEGRSELKTIGNAREEMARLAKQYDEGRFESAIERDVKYLVEYVDVMTYLEDAERDRDEWKRKYEELLNQS